MNGVNRQLLAFFEDLSFYKKHFMDVAFWDPFVRLACHKMHLPCFLVKAGLPGTFPTFIVDERRVMKFFGQRFEGQKSFQAELHAAKVVAGCDSIRTAALLGEGTLFEADDGWQWPFLVYEYLPGLSLGEVFDQVNRKDLIGIAEEMGSITQALHQLPLIPGPAFSMTRDPNLTELTILRGASPNNHQLWGALPGRLVKQIEDFLVPATDLLDKYRSPYMIHGDLTRDHLLGQMANGHWVTTGLIDWGDAWTGGFYYELAALYLDLLHGDPRLLQAYLHAYEPGKNLMEDFAHRALSAALLHRFNVFTDDLFYRHPDLRSASSLEELADLLYGQAAHWIE